MEDIGIIDLFFERSEQAVKELDEKYGRLCMKLSLNILNSTEDAEECVNESYLAVWKLIPPNRPEKLMPYLLRIVRNTAVKKLRYKTAEKRSVNLTPIDELNEVLRDRDTVDSIIDAKYYAALINSFLDSIGKEERVMFVRRYWFSESIDELAELFGISKHNVSVRLSRTRNKLKAYLEKEGADI